MPYQLARSLDGSTKKFVFKDVIPGIKGYERLVGVIDWLQMAGLIIRVPIVDGANIPFSAFAKENTFKLYVFDVGILGALADITPESILSYDYGTYKGFFAENFVAQELRFAKNEVFAWKENESEIEFLREVNGKAIPVEVKAGRGRRSRSLDIFSKKYQPPFKMLLSAENLSFEERRGLHRYPIYLASRIPVKNG